MTVHLRPAMATLPAYVAGRSVPGAIKLASNEAPNPPLPHVIQRIAEVAAGANRYPDPASSELAAALAGRFGLDPGQVAVGCGSVSLCTQSVQAVADAGEEVVYAWRSFEAYPILVAVSGATSVQVPLRDHVHDLGALAGAITERTRAVFVCNPNNPTGTVVDESSLRRFLAAVPADVLVVLDEAYREYVCDLSVADGATLLGEFANLVVLRTFSKAYGLAGLRVGYALAADPAVATAIRQTQVPFAVSQIAQAAALASLEPPAEAQLRERVEEVVTERGRVATALAELGYEVPPSRANFVWLPLGDATVRWAAGCEERKVIVRPFAKAGARVTISSPDENDRFLQAATDLAPDRPAPRNSQVSGDKPTPGDPVIPVRPVNTAAKGHRGDPGPRRGNPS